MTIDQMLDDARAQIDRMYVFQLTEAFHRGAIFVDIRPQAQRAIGANHDLVRENWPSRMGRVPEQLLSGVPAHVDGRMLGITEAAGGRIINADRMWHYTEGITNYDSIWPQHGIRILPGPSSLWLDATGKRLPAPLYPGFDTLGTLEYIAQTGHDYTWFVLNARIIEKEFGLSGQEQNPDLTGKSVRQVLSRVRPGAPAPVQRFVDQGVDFVSATTLRELVDKMNGVPDVEKLDYDVVEGEVTARDREVVNSYTKDSQITAIRGARNYLADRVARVVAPHPLTDPKAGPLIAVKLHILTRKSLGGLETDLDSRVLTPDGTHFSGLYAAGEAAGFGGGGGARVSVAGGHVPRRVRVLRARGRPGRRPGDRIAPRDYGALRNRLHLSTFRSRDLGQVDRRRDRHQLRCRRRRGEAEAHRRF